MDQAARYRELERLAGLRRDAEASRLAALQRRHDGLALQVQNLQQAAVERRLQSDRPSAFQLSGRDGLWDAWRQGRIRELSLQMAQIRAQMEAQSQAVRQAIGRHQVLGKLGDRVAAEARAEAAREAY